MKKECALCNSPAKMYCESDQASLCWSCDSKIHSANFLVAKHTRNLLCHVCQSPTPWTASGPKLGFTLSVCEICVANKYKKLLITRADLQEEEQVHASAEESSGGNEETDVDDTDSSEEEHDDDDDDDVDVESDENQVVPLSSSLAPPLRPTSTSSSVSEDSSSSSSSKMAVVSLKRIRQYADLNYQDDVCCTSSSSQEKNNNEEEATSLRPLKNQKREESFELETETSTSTSNVLVASLRKFHQQLLSGTGVSATNFGMCKSSSDNNHNNPNPIVR